MIPKRAVREGRLAIERERKNRNKGAKKILMVMKGDEADGNEDEEKKGRRGFCCSSQAWDEVWPI